MSHRFQSFADAIAAGYVAANKFCEEYRCCQISTRDTSGLHHVGYHFAISVSVPADIADSMGIEVEPTETFGDSVTVWTDDLNKTRQPGAFSVMFDPSTLADAIQKTHDWIDAFYEAHPDAVARCAKREEWLAACAARRAEKIQARKNKFASRGAV